MKFLVLLQGQALAGLVQSEEELLDLIALCSSTQKDPRTGRRLKVSEELLASARHSVKTQMVKTITFDQVDDKVFGIVEPLVREF